jgi:hypothetical protein
VAPSRNGRTLGRIGLAFGRGRVENGRGGGLPELHRAAFAARGDLKADLSGAVEEQAVPRLEAAATR